MSIKSKIEDLKEDLSLFQEELEKYEYIIELGKATSLFKEENKTRENLIHGCTSKLWIVLQNKDGKIIFDTDSETVIVRGLAQIVQNIFSQESPKDIIDFDENILASLGLTQIITPSRQNGVGNMIKRIKKYSQQYIKEN